MSRPTRIDVPPPPTTGPEHWRCASQLAREARHPQISSERAHVLAAVAEVHARLAVGALLADVYLPELSTAWQKVLR